MPNEDAVKPPSVPAELQQYAGTQASTTASPHQGTRPIAGASPFRGIPGQLALPEIGKPTQGARNRPFQSTIGHPGAIEGDSHVSHHPSSVSNPCAAVNLLRTGTYGPAFPPRRAVRGHMMLLGIVLLVARMGREAVDTLVAFDSGSLVCYISRCEAVRLGLNIAEWVHPNTYRTSKGIFNPIQFAIKTHIRGSIQGFDGKDITLDIAVAPESWGKTPLTLGRRALKKFRDESDIFRRNTDRLIHPQILRSLSRRQPITASPARPAFQSSLHPGLLPSTTSFYNTPPRHDYAAASTSGAVSLPSLASPLTSVSGMKPTGSMLATSQQSGAPSMASWASSHQMPGPHTLQAVQHQQGLDTGTSNLVPHPMQFKGTGKEVAPANSCNCHATGPPYNAPQSADSSFKAGDQSAQFSAEGPSHITSAITESNGNETEMVSPGFFNMPAAPPYGTSYSTAFLVDQSNPSFDIPGGGLDNMN